MNIRTCAALVLVLGAAPASIVACSSASTPALGSDDGGPRVNVGTVQGRADGGADASVDAAAVAVHLPDAAALDAAGLCAVAMQDGEGLQELSVEGRLPAATGGALVPGTYILTELESYQASDASLQDTDSGDGVMTGPTGYTAAKTLILDANGTFWFVEATGTEGAGLGAASTSGGVYASSGTNLVLGAACPASVAGMTNTYPYDAVGGQIALYRGAHVEIYQVQPRP